MSGELAVAAERRERALRHAAAALVEAHDTLAVLDAARRSAAELLDRPVTDAHLTLTHAREGVRLRLTTPEGVWLALAFEGTPDDEEAKALRALADQVSLALARVAAEEPALGEHVRELLGDAPDLVVVLDAVGRIVKDNLSLGDAPVATGRPFASVLHPDDAPAARDAIARLGGGHVAPHRAQWRIRGAADEWLVVDVVALNLLADPYICGIVVAGRTTAPAEEPAPAPEADTAEPEPAVARGTVLVVDDHEANRRLVRRILQQAGFTVYEAADGAEAVEACRGEEGPPDLVLCDVVLPGMSGGQIADAVHEHVPAVPVLFMSGFGEIVQRYGVTADLAKPFTAEQLLAAVEGALPRVAQHAV